MKAGGKKFYKAVSLGITVTKKVIKDGFFIAVDFLVGFILVISLIWQPKVKETDLGQKDDKSLYKYCWHKKNYNDAMHYYAKYLVKNVSYLFVDNKDEIGCFLGKLGKGIKLSSKAVYYTLMILFIVGVIIIMIPPVLAVILLPIKLFINIFL